MCCGVSVLERKKNQFILMRFKVIVEEFNRLGNHVHSLASPFSMNQKIRGLNINVISYAT